MCHDQFRARCIAYDIDVYLDIDGTTACLIGVQDLCLLSDKPIWGVVWIVVALMLLTIYSLLFLFLGECGRKRLGLKMKRIES